MNSLVKTTEKICLISSESVIKNKIIGVLSISGRFKVDFLGLPVPPFGGMEELGWGGGIWDAKLFPRAESAF